jgi:hypothetical protein
MRRPITSTTRRDGFPISEWYMPLLLSSLISVADMLTVVPPLSWEVGDGFLTCSGIFSRGIFPSSRSYPETSRLPLHLTSAR